MAKDPKLGKTPREEILSRNSVSLLKQKLAAFVTLSKGVDIQTYLKFSDFRNIPTPSVITTE